MRAQILRTAGPARSLLHVTRPIASKETCRRWARAQRRVRLRAGFVCARVLSARTKFPTRAPPHPTPPRGRKVLRTTVHFTFAFPLTVPIGPPGLILCEAPSGGCVWAELVAARKDSCRRARWLARDGCLLPLRARLRHSAHRAHRAHHAPRLRGRYSASKVSASTTVSGTGPWRPPTSDRTRS